jgi:hypothetical protein
MSDSKVYIVTITADVWDQNTTSPEGSYFFKTPDYEETTNFEEDKEEEDRFIPWRIGYPPSEARWFFIGSSELADFVHNNFERWELYIAIDKVIATSRLFVAPEWLEEKLMQERPEMFIPEPGEEDAFDQPALVIRFGLKVWNALDQDIKELADMIGKEPGVFK